MARWLPAVVLALAALAVPSQAGTSAGSKARVKQGVKAEVKRGTLRITGNRRANKVTLRLKRRRRGVLEVDVRSNGSADFSFRRRAFRRIVLKGGAGNDTLAVSERNGRFITAERTTLDGGRGRDRLAFTGSSGADSLSLSARRRSVRLARGAGTAAAAATFTLGAARVERLSVNPGAGADTVTLGDITGAGLRDVSVALGSAGGGDGSPDTVFATGTAAADQFAVAANGAGRSVTGLPWAVTASNLEAGSDRLIVVGAGGADTLGVSGTGGADEIRLFGTDGLLHASVGGTLFQSDDVEAVRVAALGGADTLTVEDLGATVLGATDVSQVALDLGTAPGGAADGLADSLIVNGGGGAENVAVNSGPAGITVAGLAATTSIAAVEPADQLTVNGLGGSDTVNSSTLAAGTMLLTLRGGADADTLTGGPSDETFAWGPGDGSDVVQGGGGADTATMDGSDAAENFGVVPVPGGHVQLTRDVDGIVLDLDDVETAGFAPGAGSDLVSVPDMPGAELTKVDVNLGGADGQSDNVFAQATNNPETINVEPTATGASVALAPTTTVAGAELGRDTLTIQALGGDDTVDAVSVPAGRVDLVLQGGLGEDLFLGSQGNDFVQGGDGDDVGLLGAGDDTFVWNPGDDNDIVEGQDGADRLLFNGANVAETIDIAANGGRLRFFRNIANVLMDCDDVEIVDFNALGGADLITVGDMTGTDVSQVNLALAAAGGAGDAQADNVVLNGTNGNDVVSLNGGPNALNVTGLLPGLSISGAEPANDRLTLNALGGNDTVNASAVGVGAMLLTLNGEIGNDSITGGDGNDTITGGPDDDFLRGGPGIDAIDGGTGTNVIIQD